MMPGGVGTGGPMTGASPFSNQMYPTSPGLSPGDTVQGPPPPPPESPDPEQPQGPSGEVTMLYGGRAAQNPGSQIDPGQPPQPDEDADDPPDDEDAVQNACDGDGDGDGGTGDQGSNPAPRPGGYPWGWYNPLNWHRGLYTGNPNMPDEYYIEAMQPAGEIYNERKGAAHGVLSTAAVVPGLGMLPAGVNAVLYELEGEHKNAAIATCEGALAGLFGWFGKARKAKQLADAERLATEAKASASAAKAGGTAAKAEETLAAAKAEVGQAAGNVQSTAGSNSLGAYTDFEIRSAGGVLETRLQGGVLKVDWAEGAGTIFQLKRVQDAAGGAGAFNVIRGYAVDVMAQNITKPGYIQQLAQAVRRGSAELGRPN